MPRSSAASRSIEAFLVAVEAIMRSLGKRSMMVRVIGVRSRMTQTMSNGCRRSTRASGPARWSLNTVTVARASSTDQSASESATRWWPARTAMLKRACLEHIACLRRDVIRSLPGPLDGFPVVCRVVSDDMSNSRERKMIAHHHDPIRRDAVQNGLARLDRLRGLIVEHRRPVGMLEAGHRIMGDVAHMHELLLARGEQD